ncbi:MAG: AbiV family abortive infection protein [Candidatus Sungiibacteriota bacterium]
MKKRITLSRIEKMAALSIDNALRFHFDSIALFKNQSYPSCFLLEVLAIEEIGKMFLLEDLWWHSVIEGKREEKEEKEWLNFMYSHRFKQNFFVRNFDASLKKRLSHVIVRGDLDILKQKSTYVGLRRQGKSIHLNKHIENPLDITKRMAEKLITDVSDELLVFIQGCIKGVYSVETKSVSRILCSDLFARLVAAWTMKSKRTASRLKMLERMV